MYRRLRSLWSGAIDPVAFLLWLEVHTLFKFGLRLGNQRCSGVAELASPNSEFKGGGRVHMKSSKDKCFHSAFHSAYISPWFSCFCGGHTTLTPILELTLQILLLTSELSKSKVQFREKSWKKIQWNGVSVHPGCGDK